ncbi:MAG: hypothetical protein U5O39_19965 [Gammaproteobacteria bacterium]|nr:hypothetical protein [Gammaproteobacteria bacterium]
MNTILTVVSVLVLLGVSSAFGFLSMPTEMGLAIVAGALGLAFANIDKIAEFSGAGFSAKMKDQLQTVIDKETEPDLDPEAEERPALELIGITQEDEHAEAALRALTNGKYTWRSIGGIAKETSQRSSEALNTLKLLKRKGLVEEGRSNSGSRIWTPTVRGSIVGAMMQHENKSG